MAVSTTARPVTQTTEVAVKSATNGDAPAGPARETGNSNSAVPITTTTKNAIGTIRAGRCWARNTRDVNPRRTRAV